MAYTYKCNKCGSPDVWHLPGCPDAAWPKDDTERAELVLKGLCVECGMEQHSVYCSRHPAYSILSRMLNPKKN